MKVVGPAVSSTKVFTDYWEPIVNTYNTVHAIYPISSNGPVDPDLNSFITNRAINGLMLLMAVEERNIRANPGSYAQDIIRRVFGGQ